MNHEFDMAEPVEFNLNPRPFYSASRQYSIGDAHGLNLSRTSLRRALSARDMKKPRATGGSLVARGRSQHGAGRLAPGAGGKPDPARGSCVQLLFLGF